MRVGVTGGIGSGKTIVCRIFSLLGVPLFDADKQAALIMDNEVAVREKLVEITGRDLYSSGRLDRALLASIIFSDSESLQRVNELVHPLVKERFLTWSEKQKAHYVIIEAAILYESGSDELTDRVITVTAPLSQRVKRVMKRDGVSRSDVMSRIDNQYDDRERESLADYLIANGEGDMVIPQILSVHSDIVSSVQRADSSHK